MGKIVGIDDLSFNKSDNEEDRIINSFYCGQIMALHHLVYYLWRAKGKYKLPDIFRFIESRYLFLIKGYPNFYNQIVKNDRELKTSGETDYTYHKLFEAMLKHFKDITQKEPNI